MDKHNEAKRDYRSTLNLPLKDNDPGAFPQRGNLPAREPEFQARWEAMDLYGKSLKKRAPKGKFVLHDGPPYSNGDIHLGTALNKMTKDIVTRMRTMQGYESPYVPGWDNHGMPIENAVARRFREEKRQVDRVTLRRACREYAAHWVDVQRRQFMRLGGRGDWGDPYLTMSREFEAKIVEVFGDLVEGGFIYRGLKPVLWCATCETALADAEVEYEPHVSNSIFVRFPLWEDPLGVFHVPGAAPPNHAGPGAGAPGYALIWTTTPWTIPANLALAVHPDAEYALVRATHDSKQLPANVGDAPSKQTAYYLVAVPLVEATMQAIGSEKFEIVKTLNGEGLSGLVFRHPLFHRTSPVVMADYVTMDAGTGVVHTAPGHGKEDFETGQKYGLEVLTPVDEAGRYTAAAGEVFGQPFEGKCVATSGNKYGQTSEADHAVTVALLQADNLLELSKIEHSYPHCWRCHSPLIFRATVQWFMNIDHAGHREKCLDAIEGVAWYPPESINRIKSMVANRPDWCISRQRAWGVGIPAFYCTVCGEHILTKASIGAVAALTRREGSDAWYEKLPEEILPAGFTCPHCSAPADKLRKETDVLDVWFDSGSTNRAVLEDQAHWPDLRWPADLYLEGGDQHRGWFNSSLMIALATRSQAPYRSVITSGWTLDEQGHAMHKSKGNAVDPMTVIEKYGADVLRWWVASTDFMEDVSCGDNVLKQVGDTYRRIRNTFRFLLNNLYDFDPAKDSVPEAQMEELDRWALAQLDHVVQVAAEAYNAYAFHKVYHAVHNFCAVELSAFYLDVLKDRLYASGPNWPERRSAQTALLRLAETLARLLAPVLVHTTEEAWDFLKLPDKPESVHLAALPEPSGQDYGLSAPWERILELRDAVQVALEEKRQSGEVRNSLEAHVHLMLDPETYRALEPYQADLPALLLVSQVDLKQTRTEPGTGITVTPAEGVKCARCWLIKTDVGADPAHPELCARCARAVSEKE
ncbi:MAG TPA: isoleucine--tRNA ligase [Chthonomonadaceae bacterium]|nr:isoleucine--tRNA ligase [Chthonomonadaceae bacterium]